MFTPPSRRLLASAPASGRISGRDSGSAAPSRAKVQRFLPIARASFSELRCPLQFAGSTMSTRAARFQGPGHSFEPARSSINGASSVSSHATGSRARSTKSSTRNLKDTAALKLLRPEFAGNDAAVWRIRHEAIAGAHVKHPNRTSSSTAGDYNGRPFFVTALARWQKLRDWLRELGQFCPSPTRSSWRWRCAPASARCMFEARAPPRYQNPRNLSSPTTAT